MIDFIKQLIWYLYTYSLHIFIGSVIVVSIFLQTKTIKNNKIIRKLLLFVPIIVGVFSYALALFLTRNHTVETNSPVSNIIFVISLFFIGLGVAINMINAIFYIFDKRN